LTPQELGHGVVYLAEDPVEAGASLTFPGVSFEAPWDALLAFVDRQPLANWAHSCRYVLVNPDSGSLRSIEARFPPFGPEASIRWRVVYQARSVPDAVIGGPGVTKSD
jgi:hypothetical protein